MDDFKKTVAFSAILLAIIFIPIEALLYSRLRNKKYDLKEVLVSLGIITGQEIILRILLQGALLFIAIFISQYRLFNITMVSIYSWVGLFFFHEFVTYWAHRTAHHTQWIWATHSVHHSIQQLVLLSGARLGWTMGISGEWIFFMVLIWVGFPIKAVFLFQGINMLYQFWLHTELVPSLGLLEYIFNTPSNHRVHHSKHELYLNKNFGGILVVFDLLFGTFQRERKDTVCEYGIVGQTPSYNVFTVVFRGWGPLISGIRKSTSLRESLAILFGPPNCTLQR